MNFLICIQNQITIYGINTIKMNKYLTDHTNQAEALASIADSLSAISCCMQYVTMILAGYLLFRIGQWILGGNKN